MIGLLLTVLVLFGILQSNVDTQPPEAVLISQNNPVNVGSNALMFLRDNNQIPVQYFILGSMSTIPGTKLLGRNIGINIDVVSEMTFQLANTFIFLNFQGIAPARATMQPIFSVPNVAILRGLTVYFVGITWANNRPRQLHISNVLTLKII